MASFRRLKNSQPLDAPIWKWNNKLAGREFAASLGMASPAIVAGPVADPGDLELPRVPLVVKPDSGSTRRGVHPLLPIEVPDEGWWHVWNEARWTDEDLLDALRNVGSNKFAPDRTAGPWFAEALVDSPYDWKFFAFKGVIPLVRQIGRTPPAVKYWTADLEPADEVIPINYPLDPELPPPRNPVELVAAAKRISEALPSPFCRIDLYDTPEGVLFQELTPRPGAPNGKHPLSPAMDAAWGALWEATVEAHSDLWAWYRRPPGRP